ncbi:spore coat U domain-containing protein [Phenylobacterium sp. LjRoot225]|uniref:spore coat protein U domain-containing protein n=1 Tax=Phenylobacterium sp. LjRoot225 TaxID=3342285 RepID=UPI003ECCC644
MRVRLAWLTVLGLSTALAAAPGPAEASAVCTLSATPLMFGQYGPYEDAPTDSTATITVTCTSSNGVPVVINGSISLTGPGAPSDRELTDGPNGLLYQLFLDPSRTTLWGDGGSGGAKSIAGTASLAGSFQETVTVYGRILARQSGAMVGAYTAQIGVVLDY